MLSVGLLLLDDFLRNFLTLPSTSRASPSRRWAEAGVSAAPPCGVCGRELCRGTPEAEIGRAEPRDQCRLALTAERLDALSGTT
jgi:hypothetical protein